MIKRILLAVVSKAALQPLYRQTRGLTLGTRTAVFDSENRVLLVRHSYGPGWFLPGGGVERGETIFHSAMREVREEAGIIAEEEPVLRGICLNDGQFPGDHVAVLTLRRFSCEPWKPGLEISAAQFFPVDQLPEGASGGTRRRLEEILSNRDIAHHW
ncbi:MAG: NUDIX domain-containing protein [Aestuariivirga sp.]|jgi:8-oxo-dGTP pyrophosphatase MutT (NUDIX family)